MCEHPAYTPVDNLGAAALAADGVPHLVLLDLQGLHDDLRRSIVADLAEALERLGEWEACRPVQPRPAPGRARGAAHAPHVIFRPRRITRRRESAVTIITGGE